MVMPGSASSTSASSWVCARSRVSTMTRVFTLDTSSTTFTRSWYRSLTDTPWLASRPVRCAREPGVSLICAVKVHRRPSTARPRSRTRPRMGVSMLPPHKMVTTFLPLSSGKVPARRAAMPSTPAPSTTIFCSSTMRKIARAIQRSDTQRTSSTNSRTSSKALAPTVGTARPSASVGPMRTSVGSPAASAAVMDAQVFGSTPYTLHSGRSDLTDSAMPAMRPPPPTGTTMASTLGTCDRISMPMVPAPAIILGSSKPLR
mmetsp:Transcript_12516/g.39556  ORF Transcript_12516/g.39556 Transcript_12516/m.39556 type:complete len:259 (-) Transcript_12516:673-1449(-)